MSRPPASPDPDSDRVNLSAPFIHRPIATSLLSFGMLLAGLVAFKFLPIAPLPQIESPTIQVQGNLPGADPITVATSVSAPLERRFAQIAGVSELTSSSSLGNSQVTIQFDLNRDIDSAARDVQAAINAAAGDLPSGLTNPPSYHKANPSDTPIMILTLSSSTLTPGDVYNYANDVIAQQLSQVSGVSQIEVNGSQKSAVRIQVDPAYLATMGLSLESIRSFVGQSNANLPKGSIDGPDNSYTVNVNDQLNEAIDYRGLVAYQKGGAAVRLGDLGTVLDATENVRQAGWYNGVPSVTMWVYKQAGANVIETTDRIRALIPRMTRWMPRAMKMNVAIDRTGTIRSSVNHIEFTLLISIALVVMVVFLFLRRFWATVIPSFTVPLALAGTFGMMYVVGYTLDNLSLMAMAVAVGFVVDDAIVVIENIVRYVEAGDPPVTAALKGARQISFTVITISVSLVAVFIPLIFMSGIVGRLLHEFALTLTCAILLSGVVSLTFTPMMCSRFLRRESEGRPNRFFHALESGFQVLQRAYERRLTWVLRHEKLMLSVTIGTMIATVLLYIVVPKGFVPPEDTGQMNCTVEGAQDISFVSMRDKDRQVIDIMLQDPAIEAVISGVSGGSNQGRMWVQLKPLEVRKVDIQTVIARLRRPLAKVEGIGVFMQASTDFRVGARMSKATYQYTMTGSDLKSLHHWSAALLAELRQEPHFQDVTTDLQIAGLQTNIVIDRAAASRLNLTLGAIDNTLYDAFGQRQISTIYTTLTQHHVVLEASPKYQFDPASLDKIFVKSSTGRMVPLSAVSRFDRSNTSLSVNHQGQFPADTISFNLDPGYSLSDATATITAIAARLNLPSDIHASFQGTAKVFQDSLSSVPLLMGAALLAVYLILGMLYESLIHPLTILSTLPSAGVGALLALIVTGNELSIIADIGIILLIGLVKKNAIIMIDFAIDAERREGLSPEKAIYQACVVRFRPIMMTTMAAMLGALPLALESGVGAELHRPLGISIVGGLILSQMLTLFTTPVVYVTLDRLRHRVAFRRRSLAVPLPSPLPERA
jgi:hydrophobe/amphiphile efflux-1 (HAE1) family protein